MKVLLDECVDPRVATYCSNAFEVRHVKDMGWLGTKNGDLVKRASEQFDVLFTIDSNMRHQTSLKNLALSVVVAAGHFHSTEDYRSAVERFELVASSLEPGRYHLL